MIQTVVILGSTGSIGKQALDICRKFSISPIGLSASSDWKTLLDQILEFKPKYVALRDLDAAILLKDRLKELCYLESIEIFQGDMAASNLAQITCDQVLVAIVGMAGLAPSLSAIEANNDLALANKESIVAGGDLLFSKAKSKGIKIHPVDSEHSAIAHCLSAGNREDLSHIFLTASGGPFRNFSKEALKLVTAEQALKHPTWKMGTKISIDSATLINKGLELIEACRLFNLNETQIKILVHPESVVHSAVAYKDGSVIAQLAVPDMRLPIQASFSYPQRIQGLVQPLDFFSQNYGTLHFEPLDESIFEGVSLAREAIRLGGDYPLVLNAANEIAVSYFLKSSLSFNGIYDCVRYCLSRHKSNQLSIAKSFDELNDLDMMYRVYAKEYIERL